MTYRIDLTRPLAEELRRVAVEELAGAGAELQRAGDERAIAIHEARKRLKKTRAVLRLIRPHLGPRFAIDNAWIRDTARWLSSARDAEVLVETARDLRGRAGAAGLEALECRLAARAAAIRASSEAPDLDAIGERIRIAAERVSEWPVLPDDASAIRSGLGRVYRRGRRARKSAAAGPADDAAMHEWRKRAKELWYATRLFHDADPVVAAHESNLDVLCDRLGKRHDLDVLEETLHREPGLLVDLPAGDIHSTIAAARKELDDEAFLLGSVIYAAKPGQFAEPVEAFWQNATVPLVEG